MGGPGQTNGVLASKMGLVGEGRGEGVAQVHWSDASGWCWHAGMSSQAGGGGLAQGTSAAQPQTYFERIFWSQASRKAACAVVSPASRY